MDVKTAVVIPTCNRPELLKRAVRSALRQETQPDEVLVVNDGPAPIALDPDPRIRIISTKVYEGLPSARSLGLANLSPNIFAVAYVDDDDELLPNHISSLLPSLQYGHAFAFSKATFKYADGTETEDPEPNNHGIKHYYSPTSLLTQNIAPVSSFMHTVAASSAIGGWDKTLIRLEDWDFWGRMFIKFGPPAFVDKVTNVIHKGTTGNLTDSSGFSYSMACSWRDLVEDRLTAMAKENHYQVTSDYLSRFHIPKIGIVMPFYNAENYIKQAIESILDQTYSDFELIGINDGSTDSSPQIFLDFVHKDRRLRYFGGEQNLGVTKALNFGLLVSRSEFIARMDADDVSLPTRFEEQIKLLEQERDLMVVGTNFLSMNEDLTKVNWNNELPTDPERIKAELLTRCCVGHPTVMFRRRIIEIVGGYSEDLAHKAVEDYELWLRISKSHKIKNIPKPLLKYREYDTQVSKQLSEEQKENTIKLQEKYGAIK